MLKRELFVMGRQFRGTFIVSHNENSSKHILSWFILFIEAYELKNNEFKKLQIFW